MWAKKFILTYEYVIVILRWNGINKNGNIL
jgi:hypothetical protein